MIAALGQHNSLSAWLGVGLAAFVLILTVITLTLLFDKRAAIQCESVEGGTLVARWGCGCLMLGMLCLLFGLFVVISGIR